MDNLTETKLTSEKIYSGCILDFYRDTVRLPNGGTAPRELSRHVGAVCIAAARRRPRDRRAAVSLPGERGHHGDPRRQARQPRRSARGRRAPRAARVDRHPARELIPLGPFYPAAAYSDEVIWMYLARGLTFGEQQLDDDEFLNLQAVPLDELARDVLAGRIPDAKTQAAILRVYCMEHGFEPK